MSKLTGSSDLTSMLLACGYVVVAVKAGARYIRATSGQLRVVYQISGSWGPGAVPTLRCIEQMWLFEPVDAELRVEARVRLTWLTITVS